MKNTIIDRTIPCPKLSTWWLIQPDDPMATAGELDVVRAKSAAEAFLRSKFDFTKIKVKACPIKKGRPRKFALVQSKRVGPWVTPDQVMTEVAA